MSMNPNEELPAGNAGASYLDAILKLFNLINANVSTFEKRLKVMTDTRFVMLSKIISYRYCISF